MGDIRGRLVTEQLHSGLSTPVLFVVFNRPDTTARVFEAIRLAKPRRLFVAADGPRADREGDGELCEQCRRIVGGVDWECEVMTLFRDENLGCKLAVSSAITWFFENVDQGIILEDDCLPEPSFFPFCEEVLQEYQDDERVMFVNGSNFQFGRRRGSASFYFSVYPHVWGWATWKRAWKHFDVEMTAFPQFVRSKAIERQLTNRQDINFWLNVFRRVYRGKVDTWDFQWVFAIWRNSGLTVTPNTNMVANIGFDERATHTKIESDFSHMETQAMSFPLIFPETIEVDKQADYFVADTVFLRKETLLRMVYSGITGLAKRIVKGVGRRISAHGHRTLT